MMRNSKTHYSTHKMADGAPPEYQEQPEHEQPREQEPVREHNSGSGDLPTGRVSGTVARWRADKG
jgi:hypothetical protein